MSQYTNQSDILAEIQMADLIKLTDDEPKTGSINVTILTQVIANASGEIDRMVGNRYSVPFNPAPPSVESMAIVITCYRLFRRREVPDEKNKFYDDYRDIQKFLKGVKDGDEQLDLSVSTAFEPVQFNQRPTIYGFGNYPTTSM